MPLSILGPPLVDELVQVGPSMLPGRAATHLALDPSGAPVVASAPEGKRALLRYWTEGTRLALPDIPGLAGVPDKNQLIDITFADSELFAPETVDRIG